MTMSYRSRYFAVGLALVMLLAAVPTAMAQGTPTVQVVQNASLGSILTDSRGMTLYCFTPDQANVSNCNGQCAVVWPPLLLAQGNPVGGPGAAGTLGVITRQDGSRQVTYNGLPLYDYSLDTRSGDVNGQGVQNIWYVVKTTDAATAAGNPAQHGSSASAGSWYTILPGQTLAMLGRMFGVSAFTICSANQLANCNYIQAGERLWIPSGSYGQQAYSSPSYQQPYSYSAPYANRPYSYQPLYRMPYSYSAPYMNRPYSYMPSYRMPYSSAPNYRPYSYTPSNPQPYPYGITNVNWPYRPFVVRPFVYPPPLRVQPFVHRPFIVRRFVHPPFVDRRCFFVPFAVRPFAHPRFPMSRLY